MTDSNKEILIDPLQLYFERPIQINEYITITQPTVGQIIDFGEQKFYNVLYKFIGNTTMFRLNLWDNGIDWNQISDYELFIMLTMGLGQDETSILFGDLDFRRFEPKPILAEDNTIKMVLHYNGKKTLFGTSEDFDLDEDTYKRIALSLRTLFGIFPKNEFARSKVTKQAIIWEERENLRLKEKDGYQSMLLPLVSSCLNHPGFKYKKKELEQVGIFEFMDAVQRLQIYESTTALLKGAYSGFMDTSKIAKEEFNFMRDITRSK